MGKSFKQSEFERFFASELFRQVQLRALFPDSKTFADAIANSALDEVMAEYQKNSVQDGFDLQDFVASHFQLPRENELNSTLSHEHIDEQVQHLWQVLRKPADIGRNDSLIALPNAYTVPGGRFREVYYWDSYFAAIGLLLSGQSAAVKNLLENFIYLQNTVGLIPNGNRWYYAGRSQPPVLALLAELVTKETETTLAERKRYQLAVEQEYEFWMSGVEKLEANQQHRRVCKLANGMVLNRYFDDHDGPRPESYAEDIELNEQLANGSEGAFYRNVRAACESGWDFSTRWFKSLEMQSIATTQILPIDLNSLLYFTETYLAKCHADDPGSDRKMHFQLAAERRKQAINEVFWCPMRGNFVDYWFDEGRLSEVESLAGVWPLFVGLASQQQADAVAQSLQYKFLNAGGMVTTLNNSGQQWDAPNGWAPLQWITVQGLHQYGHHTLAIETAQRWLETVQTTYTATGKFMEKYDVSSPEKMATGGEYEVQEGFGWTNGVTLGLIDYLGKVAPGALAMLSLSKSKLKGFDT